MLICVVTHLEYTAGLDLSFLGYYILGMISLMAML